ncbi:MAG: membrane protein [Desulfobulbaceae bacterium BRH_c16a]|nr:MAG: membrane protein [Desulfobulbaceae bacterium BRH_c16a]
MTRTIKVLPFFIGLPLICFFVEPIRTAIEQLILLFGQCDVGSVKEYILSFGVMAPVISFGLMLFQALIAPLPAFLITFANAALFGWAWGALLSWSSAMAGAALCFAIARLLGREATEKITTRFALEELDPFFQQYGKHTILIARLLPFISFDIVSYAAGLTSMSFSSFFWATGLGQLPATLMYSYAGGMLTGGAQKFVFGLLLVFAVSVLAFLLKKIWSGNKRPVAGVR